MSLLKGMENISLFSLDEEITERAISLFAQQLLQFLSPWSQ
jgi:hypothetical protein